MSERSWMPMYWGDYVRDTLHLNNAQHGAYLMLIAAYWISGKPLPDNNAELARIARCSPNWWTQNRNCLLRFFDRNECGQWVHKRVEKELLRCSARSAAASTNARSSRARAGTQPQPDSESTEHAQSPAKHDLPNPSCEGSGAPSGATHSGNGIAKPKAENRGTRLPEDWEPGSEGIQYARDLGMSDEQIRASYGAFMRYWLAKAGTAGRKLRWDLTWQTWVRSDYERIREKAERDQWRSGAARR